MPNKSMDVRRKQRLSYERRLLPFGLRVAGFRPRHLNRSTLSVENSDVKICNTILKTWFAFGEYIVDFC
jgi:hypothetical protein